MGEALNDADVRAAAALAAVGITDREQFDAAMKQFGISAALESRRGDLYDAFVEAYQPDPKNDRHAQFLREAAAGEATATAALVAADGAPLVFKLDAAAMTAYAAATTLRERELGLVKIGGKQLRERGARILERLAHVGSLDAIAPQDEALLRSLGAIAENDDGNLVLRERALLESADLGAGYDDGYGVEGPASGGQLGYTGSSPFDNAYLPYGQGPFGQQQYLADQWDMLAKCLAGDTPIPLLDGTSPTIRELAERGDDVWLYSCDAEARIVPAIGRAARQSGVKDTLFVDLDNGETLRLTYDHRMLLRDGHYREAGELRVGDRLMPFDRRTKGRSNNVYESVYHPGMGLWEQTHHMVARNLMSAAFFAREEAKMHIHVDHRNENSRDNHPANIQVLTRADHLRKTVRFGLEINPERFRATKGKTMPAEQRAKIAASHIGIKPSAETREKLSAARRRVVAGKKLDGEYRNHRVVALRAAGPCEVYDLTVDGTANFAVGQGVVVHNSFWLSTHHPVARQALYVLTNFPLGRGVVVRSKDKEQQAVIDEFAEANSLNSRLVTWWTDWLRDGETFLYAPTSTSDDESILRVDSIDPNTIWEIVTDAANPADIKYFRQQFQTRMQLFSSGAGGQAYIVRDLKPQDVLHAKLNVAAAEMRGRSQLMPSFGWLKMLSDHFTTMVVSEQAAAATTWDLTVKGNASDVGMVLGAFTLPTAVTPGTVNAHNDAVEVKKIFGAANSTVSSGGSAYQGLLNLAVMGFGLAMEYFGGASGGATRAASLMASDPPVQLMLMLQTLGRERILGPLIRKQLRWAQKTGRLAPGPLDYAIDFPALVSADANDRRKALYEGVAMGFVSHKLAAQSFAQEENLRDYDYDAEMKQIAKEQADSLSGVEDPENPGKSIRPPASYTWTTYGQTERWTSPSLSPLSLDANPPAIAPGLPGVGPAPPNGKLPAGPPAATVAGNGKHPASVSGRADVPHDSPGA